GRHRRDGFDDGAASRRPPCGRQGRPAASQPWEVDMNLATTSKQRLDLDAVGLHVLHNALANIAAEMAIVMMKTSYSTIFNEGLDFSTMLLDREGNLIAEKNFAPSMMGAV